MAIFPTSPSNGDVHIKDWIRYVYSSSDNSWKREEDPNLIAQNIKSWVTINWVSGSVIEGTPLVTWDASDQIVVVNWRNVYYRRFWNVIFLSYVLIPNPTYFVGQNNSTAQQIANALWETLLAEIYTDSNRCRVAYHNWSWWWTTTWDSNNRILLAIEVS